MQLDQPQGLKEELYQRLLLAGLAATDNRVAAIAEPRPVRTDLGTGAKRSPMAYSMKLTTPPSSDFTRASDSTR
jgi:hypothetical protein